VPLINAGINNIEIVELGAVSEAHSQMLELYLREMVLVNEMHPPTVLVQAELIAAFDETGILLRVSH
jgi:hypothetical protein